MLKRKNNIRQERVNDKIKQSTERPSSRLHDSEEQLINWKLEAVAIIDDIKDHVADIHISEKLPSSACNIYLNLRTIEGATYCVCASGIGFRLVSDTFDNVKDVSLCITQNAFSEVFESMYALLDQISPCYVKSFGHGLCMKLLSLQQQQQQQQQQEEQQHQYHHHQQDNQRKESDVEACYIQDKLESSQSTLNNYRNAPKRSNSVFAK